MSEIYSFLKNYSLEEHYKLANGYINSRIDWKGAFTDINNCGVSYFDVSDAISLFPHLELDPNYKLICYLGKSYHGVWGRIAAIEYDDNIDPVFDLETKNTSKFPYGKRFELPQGATPPMEAIYHDGSDIGLLEAVLYYRFIAALPYAYYEHQNWDIILDEAPQDLNECWIKIVDVENWTPRRFDNSIIAFSRDIENGIGASDGRDRIYLTQFNFQKHLGFYHAFKPKNNYSMYNKQINDDRRYSEKRHCCVFEEKSVLVAIEKVILELEGN